MTDSPTHLLNIVLHIVAGCAAMSIGLLVLASAKATSRHRARGRLFVALTFVVCATGVIGNVFFRFIPLFAVLTVLVSYQLLSGWHVIYTKSSGPNWLDALLAAWAGAWAMFLIPMLLSTGTGSSASSVVYSSLGALVALLVYDTARWFFPRRWHVSLWRYEHIFKVVSSLFAMLSAASGNAIRWGQPWSQLAPSVVGVAAILWFFWRESRTNMGLSLSASERRGRR